MSYTQTNKYTAKGTLSGAQTIANLTTTIVNWTAEDFDGASMHSTSSNTSRLNCVKAGKYLASCLAHWASNNTGARQIGLKVNGTTIIESPIYPNNGIGEDVNIHSDTLNMVVGDYLEMVVWQASGGNLDLTVGSFFVLTRIGD